MTGRPDDEALLLGALVDQPDRFGAVALRSDYFAQPKHAALFQAIAAAHAEHGERTESAHVIAALRALPDSGKWMRLFDNGAAIVEYATAARAQVFDVEHQAELVIDAAERRHVRAQLQRAAQKLENPDADASTVVGETIGGLLGGLRNPDGSGWGTPEPIDEIDRTPLPASSVNSVNVPAGALWNFVDSSAEALQVPRDMVFLLVLSILSTSSGGRWRVRVAPDWIEPLALMTVTSMTSGSRKSASVKMASAPLYEVEQQLVAAVAPTAIEQQALRDVRISEVERLKRKAGKDGAAEVDLIAAMQSVDDVTVPPIPRLLADDITPERLGSLMAEQGGRMGVISAEGGLFAILAGRYSSGKPNLDLVLKAHAGDPVRVDRIGRPPLMIDEPFLAIGVTVQPDILEGLDETGLLRGTGLLARFLYGLPASMLGHRKLDPDPIPGAVSGAYKHRVKVLAQAANSTDSVTDLTLTRAAKDVLWQFRKELEPELDPVGGKYSEIVDWASKLPGHLVRIAALFTLFDDVSATVVDEPAMSAAVGLADYLTGQALAAFDVISGRNARTARPRAVVSWIRRKNLNDFTARDVRRALGGQDWAKEMDNVREVLDDLADLGWIRLRPAAQTGRVGRPGSERYDVNPATHRKGHRHD